MIIGGYLTYLLGKRGQEICGCCVTERVSRDPNAKRYGPGRMHCCASGQSGGCETEPSGLSLEACFIVEFGLLAVKNIGRKRYNGNIGKPPERARFGYIGGYRYFAKMSAFPPRKPTGKVSHDSRNEDVRM